jgi:uncharacterized protein YegP (UPF0339 family)
MDVSVVNVNDDLPSLSIQDATVVEADGGSANLVFSVSLSETVEYDVSVGYATRNGSALAGSDYVAATGVLGLSAGTPSGTIPVVVNGDTLVELDETFFVELSNPVGANIAVGSAVGTIVNEDAPTLAVSATSAAMGELVQVSVADGPGNRTDWVALASVGSASTSYVDWKYLSNTRTPPSAGLTSAELAFAMPSTPGNYELRFFANNGYNLLATSPAVAVRGPTLTVSPSSTTPGASVVVTVAEGPGNRADWVALSQVGSAPTSYLDWKYLSGTRTPPPTGLTSANLTFTMPQALGQYEFRFFANNSYTLFATSPVVTVDPPTTPVLQVSPTSLSFGTVATGMAAQQVVTVKNAGAGTLVGQASAAGDGFSLVGPADYSLGPNATAALAVRFAPVASGPASGTLTLTGAGGATVPLSGEGISGPTISLSATTVPLGGSLEVTVSNGPGNRNDWVALSKAGSAPTSYLDWKYLNGTKSLPAAGLTSATLTFVIPQTMGEYEFRFFANNVLVAKSPVVTTLAPTLMVSATSIAPGGSIQVTVANGPAYRADWVALAKVGSATSSYLDWKYLNDTRSMPATGVSSATLTFTMPQAPGQYEFRLFANNGYTLLTVSSTVVVEP